MSHSSRHFAATIDATNESRASDAQYYEHNGRLIAVEIRRIIEQGPEMGMSVMLEDLRSVLEDAENTFGEEKK